MMDLFDACLPDRPGVERRKMFGCPCAFVQGNMFAGLFQDIAFARLPPSLRADLEAEFGAQTFEPMPGRRMQAYLVLPEAVLDDEAQYGSVLASAYAFTSALPPKVRKPRRGGKGAGD
jgi:TfoX/Sxy family transcriptional regulator of competence genes